MGPRRKRKSKTTAPAVVTFTAARDAACGDRRPCVMAECAYGGTKVGPVWGHSAAAVRVCLARLTAACDCGRRAHKSRYVEGSRVAGA